MNKCLFENISRLNDDKLYNHNTFNNTNCKSASKQILDFCARINILLCYLLHWYRQFSEPTIIVMLEKVNKHNIVYLDMNNV